MSIILTCNAGSTNVKLATYDGNTLKCKAKTVLQDSPEAIRGWLASVGMEDIRAVGHRVVHGGNAFKAPERITDSVLDILKDFAPLAPLHQPPALKMIGEALELFPNATQVACFDTAFHQTMPAIERRLPLPRALHEEGIMRYGFHGLSYQHVANVLPSIAGARAHGRVIVAHMGGGASACAMHGLQSVAVTMSFSTLDGLMMGTRCGALDTGVVLHLLQEKGLTPDEVSEMLYRHSGLKGVSGTSGEMRELLQSTDKAAQEAVELYCHLAARQIAGLIPALGGLDVLVFTGGIGENAAPVRDRIIGLLNWIQDIDAHVVPANEELVIASACKNLVVD